jgi:hypothetical protein
MQEERYNTRDRTYSAWHRRLSTRRFVGLERAQLLAMIDIEAPRGWVSKRLNNDAETKDI